MAGKQLSIDEALRLLKELPDEIAKLTEGLSPEQLCAAPLLDVWSAVDLLAHLRSCADVWGDCIARILAEEQPTLRAVSPRSWTRRSGYRDLAFAPSFGAFRTQRAALLAVLEPLPPEGWTRSAMVNGAGAPLERTVQFYAQWLALHERSHIAQFEQIGVAFAGS